jgi:hypothetical protein
MNVPERGGQQVRVRYKAVVPGAGPSERVVSLPTSEGHSEEVVVDEGLIKEGGLTVSQLGRRDDSVLVELPRESVEGNWRIWVPAEAIA